MSIQRSGTPDLDDPQPKSDPWGRLLSLNPAKVQSQDLRDKEITIGRNTGSTIVINDNRLSGNHCRIAFDADSCIAILHDLSTNGTFLGDQRVGKGNQLQLKNGDEIYLLHKTKVPMNEIIGFAFLIQNVPTIQVVSAPVEDQKQLEKLRKLDQISEDMTCPICDDLIYQAVILMPCLHNFCGACFSDWMAKQKTCPSCRKDVETVSHNPTINNLVDRYLDMHPEKKRPDEEYKAYDEKNKIGKGTLHFKSAVAAAAVAAVAAPPPVQPQAASRGRGRGRGAAAAANNSTTAATGLRRQISDYSASSDDEKPSRECQTCKKEINGFKCKPRGQTHVNCTNCAARMPRLPPNDQSIPHCCQLCERSFCSLYNKGCAVLSKKNINQRLKDIAVPDVDIACFRQNYMEHKFFTDYMRSNGIAPQDILKHMLDNYISKGLFRYVVSNRTHTNLKSGDEKNIQLSLDYAICTQCVTLVWQQIVFRYRIAIKDKMQDEVKNRGNCYYGINCRTMNHNQEHAKKLDHICEQTKF